MDLSGFEVIDQKVFQRKCFYRISQRSQKFVDLDLNVSSYDPRLPFVYCIAIVLTSYLGNRFFNDPDASSGLVWKSFEVNGADFFVFFVNHQQGALCDVNSDVVPALF